MNKEEQKAIEFFEKSFKKKIPPYWYDDTISNIEEKIKTVLNLIQKQDKIIDAMKYRVVLTEEEHRMILKMLERRSNKRYEDCVVEYFKKVVDEDE